MISGLLQCLALYNTSLGTLAILTAGQIDKEAGEPVITGCGIVVKVNQGKSGHSNNLIFNLSDKHWIKRGSSWNRAITRLVEHLIVHDMMQQGPPFNTEVKIEIPFINV